jgi:hypothetical protein
MSSRSTDSAGARRLTGPIESPKISRLVLEPPPPPRMTPIPGQRTLQARPVPHDRRRMIRLLLAVVAALCLLGGRNVSASVVTGGSSQPRLAAKHHHCKCGLACKGASCCCSSDEPTAVAQPSTPKPVKRQIPQPAGPCAGTAPCGGEGLPGSPGATVVKAAALGLPGILAAATSCPERAVPATPLQSALLAARLDDPPEAPALV